MNIESPEQFFTYIKSTSAERILDDVNQAYDYEKNYQRYKIARIDRLWKDKDIVRYVWYRYLGNYRLVSKILSLTVPQKFPKGYFDVRPFEQVFKNLSPAPYKYSGPEAPSFEEGVFEIKENIEEYQKIYRILADDLSKHTLYIILRARLTRDPALFITENVYISDKEPCFDKTIYQLPPNSVYVDCGGYNGDTVKKFIDIFKYYARIYVFEPDVPLIETLKHNLRKIKDVVIKNEGVSNRVEEYSFQQSGGGGGRIVSGDMSDSKIQLTTLDHEIKEPIHLIKMDIEGAEVEALQGAREHISQEQPILAINVYHRLGDIRDCFREITSANSNYKFYLRHYCYIYIKTVLYAIKK